MSKQVAKKIDNAVPAHLQGGKTTKIGNIDSSDLIIPRVKLLQAISPEVDSFDGAKKGEFWHTIASESMGSEIRAVPIILRKTFVLWSPRNDDRGILARASDGVYWDEQFRGLSFEVKPKGSPHPVKYTLGDRVMNSVDGAVPLSEFGSSIPGDDNSPPAAALTYQFLWYFLDAPEMSPAIIINTRSSVKPAKGLLSKIDLRPVDHFGQVFKISTVQEQSDDGPYYNYTYTADGYVGDSDVFDNLRAMYDRFNTVEWQANDETEDPEKASGGGKGGSGKTESNKY